MPDQRLFGIGHAFDDPVTVWLTAAAVGLLLLAPLVFIVLSAAGVADKKMQQELWRRWKTWMVIAPLMIVPVLLGAAFLMLAVLVLSLMCFREFARATGLFRNRALSAVVVLGIFALTFAIVDHWYNFFVALFPLTVAFICAVGITPDQPKGYIQRVALGIFGFMLFGCALGHLSYMGNDSAYRPIVLMVIFAVELNDVFAFICGKLWGTRKLAPNTSPNKTVEGAVGALVLTTAFVVLVGRQIFAGTNLDSLFFLVLLGLIISIAGQLGDLMLSSIKRDLGIKDTGTSLPGHGGLLDRFDSLLLVSPAVFHYVGYLVGFGLNDQARILTG